MVFGGCSKEEATTAATTTAASTEPIKLGYLTSQSGMFGQTAKYYNDSVDMIVEKYNKAGGVLGRQIQIVKADDAGSAETAVLRANDLLSQGCVGIFGTLIDSTEAALAGWAVQNKVPVVCASAGAISLRLKDFNRYAFFSTPTSAQMAKLMALALSKDKTASKIYFLCSDLEIGHSTRDYFWTYMKQQGASATEAGVSFLATSQTQYADIISAIVASKADTLISVIMGPGWVSFIQQAKLFGLFDKMKVIGAMAVTSDITTPLGKDYPTGIGSTCQFPFWLDEAPIKSYQEEFYKRTGLHANDLCMEFSNSCQALIEAIKKANSTDREKVTDALSGITITVPTGTITYSEYDHQANMPLYWVTTGFSDKFPIAIGLNVTKYQTEIYMTKDEVLKERAK